MYRPRGFRAQFHTNRIHRRLWLMALEERAVPAALVVMDAGDTGAAGQLRQVMAIADSNGQDDTITFQAGITTINLLAGQISLTNENKLLTIDGGSVVTINGDATASASNRIFDFNVAAGNPTIALKNLTLANGNLSAGNGGAIQINNDPLVCNNVTFNNNQTVGAGGAICNTASVAATLNLTNCNFTSNTAGSTGGAIHGISTISLTVTGGGFTNNTAAGIGGVFSTASTAASSNITINAATFTGNSTTVSTGVGGALSNGSSSTTWNIGNSTFTSNSATSTGGAISSSATSATIGLTGCTFTGNSGGGSVAGSGGALRVTGASSALTIDSCTFSGNSANGPGTIGGAINFNSATATLVMTNTTISGNTSSGGGGGIYIGAASTTTNTITNCTVSGNNAATFGGGVAITASNLTINSSTIHNNTAVTAGGGLRKSQISGTGALTLNSTIVAGNTAGTAADISSSATTITINVGGGKNLIGVTDQGNFTLSGLNKTGTTATPLDAKLNSLGNNGGPTQTHSLMAGSPAFNNGSNVLGLTFDQRGSGFPRINGAVADVGALEGISPEPGAVAVTPAVPPANATYVATVTYTDDTGINTGGIGSGNVRLTGPGYGAPEAPTSFNIKSGNNGDKTVVVDYIFNPPGGSWNWEEDGTYTLTMQANQVYDTDGPNSVPDGVLTTFLVAVPLPNPLIVDNNGDGDDSNFGSGNLTLREAIRIANTTAGQADVISFAAGITSITVGSALTITDPVTIAGPGAANLTISGGNATRIFSTAIATVNAPVTFSGLTLTGGQATTGSAILATTEAITVSNCLLTSNSNTGSGGAITITGASKGSLTVNNSVFDNNASQSGGAISVTANAALSINNSLFTNNATTLGNLGGAVRFVGSTTVPVNVAIRNSTFTGNKTTFHGGAIGFTTIFQGMALVQNCTITGNYSDSDDSGSGDGGGVGMTTCAAPGKVVLDSCIVSGNFKGVSNPVANDLQNNTTTFMEANYCLIGDASTAGNFTPDVKTTAVLGQAPMLDVLANNGGPTQTFALLAGSPAIDNGSNPASLSFDQRGAYFGRNAGAGVDIGAYEVQVPSKVTNVQINDGSPQRSRVTSVTLTFSNPVTWPASPADAIQLKRQSDNALVTLNAAVAGNVVTLTFTGGAVDFGSLADGRYTLTINALKAANLDGDGNGIAGDDYALIGDPTTAPKLFRLYGDADGNGLVDGVDFGAFRSAFNTNSSIFDFDGSGVVDGLDFGQFRQRFGVMI